ncbi:hypothetical protein I545_1864 [Mycobacterium kansasii 662]|uniref:Uncharacterized protein n=2 Tax=Mycobacterium kansasii TaxID=1768 RepID=A0A1V3XPK3_MYCKA|nr:hypothetical protein I547_3648 [Mycobacterium kansasii 824]EUA19917.1 hypothetical protein I545_1864 [Mycobacterium kansasii 662]KEP39961.1 hypothetical protein MKSMC1_50090 [Mycobacterium kansasii]OOK81000.1 hypothetical protein BZL29_2476 [Mycobacterium kansasii]
MICLAAVVAASRAHAPTTTLLGGSAIGDSTSSALAKISL